MPDASTRISTGPAFPNSPLNLGGWVERLTGKPSKTLGGVGLEREMYDSFAAGGNAPAPLRLLIQRFAQGEFDLVGVGRAPIADPAWVSKVRAGETRNRFEAAMIADLH